MRAEHILPYQCYPAWVFTRFDFMTITPNWLMLHVFFTCWVCVSIHRCAKYPTVPSQCMMVADPKDPQCCQIPQCLPTPGPNGFPTPKPGQNPIPTIVTNVPGVITGKPPTPTPGTNGQTPAPRSKCVTCVFDMWYCHPPVRQRTV